MKNNKHHRGSLLSQLRSPGSLCTGIGLLLLGATTAWAQSSVKETDPSTTINDRGAVDGLVYNPPFSVKALDGLPILPLVPSYTGATTKFEVLGSPWFTFRAPELEPVDPADAHYEVQGPSVTGTSQGRLIRLSDGMGWSFDYPTARAIEKLGEDGVKGGIIRINSPGLPPDKGPIQVGGGDAGIKAYRADWVGTPLEDHPIDVKIIGANPDRTDFVYGFGFFDSVTGTPPLPTPGVDGIRFENLTVRPSPPGQGVQQCFHSPLGVETTGIVHIIDCNLIGRGDGGDGGFGCKWGIRARGRMRWDCRRIHFGGLRDHTQPPGSLDQLGIQEHCVYIDSPQGDCYFVDLTMERTWRTMIQIVNRRNEGEPLGLSSGFGNILFENCQAHNIWGEGGSAFTVAGHPGTLVFRNCTATESPGQPIAYGLITVWVDIGKGVWTTPSGYPTERVVIESTEAQLPHADRAAVTISGAQFVEVYDFDLVDTNGQLNFKLSDAEQGGDVYPNDVVGFYVDPPVSGYSGFGPMKVKDHGMLLSDLEIDGLHEDRESLPLGVTLDAVTGLISGTPTDLFPPALRHVRASNASGSDVFAVGFWYF